MNNEKTDSRFVIGLILGGIVGAILLYFYSSRDGKKSMGGLKNHGQSILAELQKMLERVEHKGKEMVEESTRLTDHVAETMTEAKSTLATEASKKIETALAELESLQEQGLATTTTLRKKLFKNIPRRR